jgi:large subunit ribosomal protein L2
MNLKLKYCFKKSIGRNGKILCRTKGRIRARVVYRFIDFYLNMLMNNIFIYLKYIHDSFRNAKLLLCLTIDGFLFYILGPHKQELPSYFNLFNLNNLNIVKYGQPCKITQLTEGDFIFNISFYKDYFGQLCRSAGKSAQIIKLFFFNKFSLIKLRNGLKLLVCNNNNVFYGVVNNEFSYNLIIGKAGSFINKGFKPIVRGIAKNPVDHPNGGRTPGGKVYRSFSYKIARNLKKTFKISNLYVTKF